MMHRCNVKKCIILNFWWSNNYGAMLTCYALQTYLKSNNFIASALYYRAKNYKLGLSQSFSEKYLDVTEGMSTTEQLQTLDEDDLIYIAGSDQIWRYRFFWKYGKTAWQLDFAKINAKKIACAASFGQDYFEGPPHDIDRIKYFMRRFDHISVREDSGVDICRNTFNVEATHILDPIFWLQPVAWDAIINNSTASKDGFLAAYILDSKREITDFIKKTRESLDLAQAVVIPNAQGRRQDYYSAEDFLYYLKNCEFLVTDSFHGVCFAIIFNKPFICIRNRERGEARFDSLFRTFSSIAKYCVDRDDLAMLKIEKNFFAMQDYVLANETLERERERSTAWFKAALEAPKRKITPEEELHDDIIRHLVFHGDKQEEQIQQLLLQADKRDAEIRRLHQHIDQLSNALVTRLPKQIVKICLFGLLRFFTFGATRKRYWEKYVAAKVFFKNFLKAMR